MLKTILATMIAIGTYLPLTQAAENQQMQLKQQVIDFIKKEDEALKADIVRYNELSVALATSKKNNAVYQMIMTGALFTGAPSAIAGGVAGLFAYLESRSSAFAKVAGMIFAAAVAVGVGDSYFVSLNEADMEIIRGQMRIVDEQIKNRLQAMTELKKQLGIETRNYDINTSGTGAPVLMPVR